MNIDRTTKLNFLNIVTDSKIDYLAKLRDVGKEAGEEHGELVLTLEGHEFEMQEYYFDESTGSISISCNLTSDKGNSGVYLDIPLSDEVLTDVLAYATKKFNKLKSVLETLK